jgi:GNAT superfamily N-acetyltransferase
MRAGWSLVDIDVTDESEQMPPPGEVERLLAAASIALGASDASSLARVSARMYSWARAIPGAVTACAHEGGLVGFGYGYTWRWDAMSDAWALRLRDQLGVASMQLDNTFAVVLLVVAPHQRRAGLGARLLTGLADRADERRAWLQADAGSPLHATCMSLGWHALDPVADPVIMLGG